MEIVNHVHIKKSNGFFIILLSLIAGVALSFFGSAKESITVAKKPDRVQQIKHVPRYARSGPTFYQLIREGESRRRGYLDYNRGSDRCTKSNRRNIPITSMTIRQIRALQRLPRCTRNRLFAVGFFQIIPVTMDKAISTLRISQGQKFTPRLQDKIFALYLAGDKRPQIRRYIMTGRGRNSAGLAAALEWASLQSPIYAKICGRRSCVVCRKNRGCYDGKGSNRAHIKSKRVMNAIDRARSVYVQLTGKGYNRNSAYYAALGVKR